jgi:hypothetical protein
LGKGGKERRRPLNRPRESCIGMRAKPGAGHGGAGAAARPARHEPESGAVRRTGRDDGRGPRASDRERGEGFAGRRWARVGWVGPSGSTQVE